MYRIRVSHPQWRGGFTAIGINRAECLEILNRKFPNQDYTILEEGALP